MAELIAQGRNPNDQWRREQSVSSALAPILYRPLHRAEKVRAGGLLIGRRQTAALI